MRDVLKVLVPATFSSGTMQINVYTDLLFAAFVPGTLAALGFANLLVQTPLGIVSNIILVPFFPIFSRLSDPSQWPELKQRIRQSLVLVALTMLPMSALIITLAQPIVTVVYKRGNFNEDAVRLVTTILIAYGVGMFVYLARDVMVRVFYALGDGQTPFRISVVLGDQQPMVAVVTIGALSFPGQPIRERIAMILGDEGVDVLDFRRPPAGVVSSLGMRVKVLPGPGREECRSVARAVPRRRSRSSRPGLFARCSSVRTPGHPPRHVLTVRGLELPPAFSRLMPRMPEITALSDRTAPALHGCEAISAPISSSGPYSRPGRQAKSGCKIAF